MAIFSDLIEHIIEVSMDDFSVYSKDFDQCLENLDKVLKRCQETHLVLNWEKCHFMVREGIVLGHRVSERGIEVDRTKIDVIEQLPPRTNVMGVRSFLGHAGFYRRFIKDFSRIARPLTNLLAKDVRSTLTRNASWPSIPSRSHSYPHPSFSLPIGNFLSRSCAMQATMS